MLFRSSLLCDALLKRLNRKLRTNFAGLTPQLLQGLETMHWPGNVRELENTLERMMVMHPYSEGVLDLDSPLETTPSGQNGWMHDGRPMRQIVRDHTLKVERDLIVDALKATEGNVTLAAARLGISRKGLQTKLKELGIERRTEILAQA